MYTKPVHKIAKAKRHQTLRVEQVSHWGGQKSGEKKALYCSKKKQIFPVKNPA